MPCNSDYLNPTSAELDSKRVAGLLIYVMDKLGLTNLGSYKKYLAISADPYGDSLMLNSMVVTLCKLCSGMNDKQVDLIIYDARNKTARDLADWWEEHQEADKRRIAKEKDEKDLAALHKVALSKLTAKERRALKLDK